MQMRTVCEHCRCTQARGSSSVGVCYCCQCTVCGEAVAGAAHVSCYTCRSHTHVACTPQRQGASRGNAVRRTSAVAATAPLAALPEATAASTTTTAAVVAGDGEADTTAGPAKARTTGIVPSAGRSSRGDVHGPYFCSADCAMGVQLCANPQYSTALGAAVERACAQRWAALLRTYTSDNNNTDDTNNADDNESAAAAAALCAVDEADATVRHVCATASPQTCQALLAAYVQLRYEGWQDYYAQELRTHAHPFFFAPAHVHVDDALASQLHELMTPSGQARRLCMLHAQRHPIGSVVALPSDSLWRGAERVMAGETNSYVAETMALLLDEAAVVVPVYAGALTCTPT